MLNFNAHNNARSGIVVGDSHHMSSAAPGTVAQLDSEDSERAPGLDGVHRRTKMPAIPKQRVSADDTSGRRCLARGATLRLNTK